MTEKIEWYKEVLELEPNSKVFFPLAKLLTEALREEEAVAVLEQGLARHEEFLEARLFLIDLLYRTGRREACEAQVGKLSKMFAAYAGFWQAWAACLGAAGHAPDAAAVLRLLALHFTHGSVSLHEVLDQGVTSLMAQGREGPTAPERSASVDAGAPAAPGVICSEPAETFVAPEHCLAPQLMADRAVVPDGNSHALEHAVSAPVGVAASALAAPAVSQAAWDDADEGEERFSLRTRSMAEVLAEQGDIRGALDIYHELAAAAVHPEESADLRQRITTLNARLGSAQPVEPGQPDTPAVSFSGKDKLISMLEALAERVEARAQN